jgi:hypothetical protein
MRGIGIMLLLRLAMIQTEPVMTKDDQHAERESQNVVRAVGPLLPDTGRRRWTPICAKASTINRPGCPGPTASRSATRAKTIVARIASTSPTVYDG